MAPPKSLSAFILALGFSWGANAGPCKPSASSALSSQSFDETTSTAVVETSFSSTSDTTDLVWTTSTTTESVVSDTTTLESWSSSSEDGEQLTSTVITETGSVSTSDETSNSWSTTTDITSTSPTTVSETSTTEDASRSTSTFSESSSVSDSEFPTTTTSEAAVSSTTTISEAPATTTEAGTRLGFFNGGFEDLTVDGLPWVIGRSVEIKNDPENAHGGEHYALVRFPITGTGRPVFPLRQTVTGIDGTKKYLLTFYWTFTDAGSIEGISCDFFTYFQGLLHGNMIRSPTQPVNQYIKRQLVANFPASTTAADILFHWKCWSSQPTWPGAEVRIDDVNVEVYDPPCTRREAPSDGLTCGVGRLNNPAAESHLIDFSSEWIPFDFCAQACAGTQGCKTFVHSGVSIAPCKLYSATPQELGFQESTNGNRINQPECYECRPLESD
ncbi:hypothetical protein NCS57_00921800 [Fusarium keratoplasticum]|uniref:Uncharacterized protein n=1 Tax=Fusarium keratoplasticum TaxID=1328300 RepID=A0ACC0QPH4_9HYPO|nr:hypothetical protein NCS57_00921800 [Fusarium keratoplasticum]KAI8663215.1 hypothetical protein NCS57_00921800 [Fusarium keratoplasticum]